MRSTLIFKSIHEVNELTWEDTARVLGHFICEKLDTNYTYGEIDMLIRAHRGSQDLSKNCHKVSRPLFAQFTNCRSEEKVRTSIINLTSKRTLIMYVSQIYSNKALRHRKELLETETQLAVKLNYPDLLKRRLKCRRSKWKVNKHFTPDITTCNVFYYISLHGQNVLEFLVQTKLF